MERGWVAKAMELKVDTMSPCFGRPMSIEGAAALARALEFQFRSIHLGWAGVVDVDLPVEDDLLFLVMAYEELEACLESGRAHRVFLGDGLLEVVAEREGERCSTPVGRLKLSGVAPACDGAVADVRTTRRRVQEEHSRQRFPSFAPPR